MTHKKWKNISEEPFKSIINEEYQEAKRRLYPLLKGNNRSFIKFRWHIGKTRYGGTCNKYSKTIHMNENFLKNPCHQNWTERMFRLCLRHEIAHLVYPNHSGMFLRALELLEGHRYVGHEAYTRQSPVKGTR